MFLVQVLAPGSILVRSRGSDGEQAVPHDLAAPVVTSASPGDFPAIAANNFTTAPIGGVQAMTYGQNGAIALPADGNEMLATLNGPVALAMTLGAPSVGALASTIIITSGSAFAHTVSAPSLVLTGTTITPLSTITFPAFAAANVELVSQNGLWSVVGSNGAVTFT
jgi:hypothetical protein